MSIVVPSRNRLPLLRLTLARLRAQQGVSPQDFEVIVVDDGSSDGTASWLAGLRAPFAFHSVIHRQVQGRARARNAGLALATGDVVAFLDGDTLPAPAFVATHARLHAAAVGPVCVTGYPWFWRYVFTWRFAGFSPDQRAALGARLGADPTLAARVRGGERGDRDVPLVTEEEAADWSVLRRQLRSPWPEDGPAVVADRDAAPYLWCVTRALSVARATAQGLGGFDPDFRGYGLEDWEFGYRLYRHGVPILGTSAGSCLHQEHPLTDRSPGDLAAHYTLMLRRHPDAEVALMALIPPWSERARFARACRAYHHLRARSALLGAMLRDLALAHAHAWARAGGRPVAVSGAPAAAQRWRGRTVRGQDEILLVVGDPHARLGVAILRRLSGGALP